MQEAKDLKNVALITLIISLFVVVGADLFAQVVIASTVLAEPPRSLEMFQGDYAYDSGGFWRVATSLTMLLFVIALALNWRTPRRWLLLTSCIGFVIINALSFAFVFPEYLDIVSSAYSDTVDPDLQGRGAAWERIALVRWGAVVVLGVLLLLALARPTSDAVQAEA